jgi:hypothetical protein
LRAVTFQIPYLSDHLKNASATPAATYLVYTWLPGFSWHFQHMHCLDFVENTLLATIADHHCLLRLLMTSIDERDSDRFISGVVD